jgi:hypothetical protein
MRLKYFNKSEYTSLNEALSDIRKELLSLCPTDTDDVRWSRALDGAKAYVKKHGVGGESGSAPSDDAVPESSYNGYFTIKLRTLEDGTQKIVVCDGATYDAAKGTSGVSICYVNDTIFRVNSTELSPITDVNTRYVVLKYTPRDYNEGADNSMYGVAIYDMLYEDIEASKNPCYIIGQYTIEDGEITVIQRHAAERYQSKYASNGIIYMEYIVECF